MKRVLVIAFLCIFVIVSGYRPGETKEGAAITKADPASAPVPDNIINNLSTIRTFRDYGDMRSGALRKYYATKAKAWDDYQKIKSAAWDKYSTFEKEELQKFRNSDRKSYFDWLDAEKMRDYIRVCKIEESSPAAKTYISATNAKFEEYIKTEESAYDNYESIESEAYEAYKKIESLAYDAYKNNSK